MTNFRKGIACFFALALITACTTVTNYNPAPPVQEISCSLTCDNPIYIKPGNNKFPARKIEHTRETIAKTLQLTYDKLQPAEGSTEKSNPTEAIKILNAIPTADLNASELTQIKQLKGYSYIALNQYQLAIDEFKSMIALSPQCSLFEEKTALKNLWMLHTINDQYAEALDYLQQWTAFVDRIEAAEYHSIASIYFGLKDYPNAIANLERGIEMNDAKYGKDIKDYQKLRNFYLTAKNAEKAKEIEEIILSIPNPAPWIAVSPTYPEEAKTKGIEGYCVVTFDIKPDGTTDNVHIKPGHCKTYTGELTDLFSSNSINAVKQFMYQPTNTNGNTTNFTNATYMVTFKNNNPK